MGLMSFFSRRKAPDGLPNGIQVKSQRYDATATSSPPIRGTYPVAGNGPSVMSSLSRSTKFKDGQYTIPASALPESHSPPSALSLLQHGSNINRPRTAPNGPRRDVTSSHSNDDPNAWPLAQPRNQFSHLGHQRSDSLQSTDSAGRGFVDLLDAQSGIKRTDFQTRVKAAGARVYGEDVADRNIAAAYAKVDVNGQVKLGQGARSKVLAEENRYRARVRRVNEDGGLYHQISRQISVEAEMDRTERNSDEKAAIAAKRKSTRSTIPGGNMVETTTTTTTRPRPKSFSRTVRPQVHDFTVSRTPELPAIPAGIESHVIEAFASKRQSLHAGGKVHPTHDSALFHQPNTNFGTTYHHVQQSSGSGSNPAPATSAPSEASARKQSRRKTFHASVPLSFANFAGKMSRGTDVKPSRTQTTSQAADAEEPAPSPSVRRSSSKSSFKGLKDRNNSYLRSLSLISSSQPPKFTHDRFVSDEAGPLTVNSTRGTNPMRSVRHWSLVSSTPTTVASSTTSSNMFPGRPHSQHTANTSVDMSSTSGASAKRAMSPATVLPSDSVSSLHSGNTSLTAALESPMDTILSSLNSPTSVSHPLRSHPITGFPKVTSPQPRSNTMAPLPTLDHHSKPSPTQSRSSAENDLLFRDVGYGLCGDDQLPGLGGRSGEEFVPKFRTRSPSLPNLTGRRKGYVLDTPLDYETDDEAEVPTGEGWRVDDWTSTSDEDLDEHTGSDSDLSDEEENEPLPEHLLHRLAGMSTPQYQSAAHTSRTLRPRDSFSPGEDYEDEEYDTSDHFDRTGFAQRTVVKRNSLVGGAEKRPTATKKRSFPLRPGAGALYYA